MDSTIVRLTTIYVDRLPNSVWLEIETADGRVGLGESFGTPASLTAWLHEVAAPVLIGHDADQIERHWWTLYLDWGPPGIGVEGRGISMVDVALWDLLAKRAGLPLVAMLGGAIRDAIPAYNTCAGPDYGYAQRGRGTVLPTDSRGAAGKTRPTRAPAPAGTRPVHEDLVAWRTDAGALAESLLEMGFGAMKIWPFDDVSDPLGGRTITGEQLARGLAPVRRIREAVGGRIQIAVEMHGRWDVANAKLIAHALEPFEPMWIEDPVRGDDAIGLADVAAATRIPVTAGENLGSFQRFGELVDRHSVSTVMADPSYVGGLTAAHRVADLAGQRQLAYTSHDCNGPVNLAVGVHLGLHAESASWQEMVRAYYFGWYPDFAEGLPPLEHGRLRGTGAPGHGVQLRTDVMRRPDARVRTTGASRRQG